jgi:hypothetical protein
MKAVGDELIDSIVGDNIPILAEEEKYNQTVTSSLERLAARLDGREVPGAWRAARRRAKAGGAGRPAWRLSAWQRLWPGRGG